MVFFTCFHCGESIKKPSVAKHYETACKNQTPFVTCVDCLKDFKGNEYEAHTKCFTEEERYSAKGFVPKASANKGERKQKAWSECVQGLLSSGTLEQDEKNLLGTICKHDNIPRKKGKFINFLKSTAKSFADQTDLIDRVWDKMENYFKESNLASQNNSASNDTNEKTKRKVDEIAEEGGENAEGRQAKKKKHSSEETEKANNVSNGEKIGKKKKKNKKRQNVGEKDEIKEEDEPKSKKAKKMKMNGNENTNEKKKGETEEKSTDNNDSEEGNETAEDSAFDWTDAVKKILSAVGTKNQMKLAKLKKKVLKKYGEVSGCEIDDKIIKKFSKKLNKIDSIKINGDYVSLKS